MRREDGPDPDGVEPTTRISVWHRPIQGKTGRMDAITLLKQDHKTVEKLFKQFEKSTRPAEQRKLAQKVIRELSVHAAIEEMVF